MIIIHSEKYDVLVRENRDWLQRKIFTVIYGLEIHQYTDFQKAMNQFNESIHHARACNNEH